MKISQRGLNLIITFEGFVDHLYDDPVGHCTVGYGHLVHLGRCDGRSSEGEFRQGLSEQKGRELLQKDVVRYEEGVNNAITVPLNQNQFDALVSFTYNLGVGALQNSTLRRKLNTGDYKSVPEELRRWNKAGGKILEGLVRRREAEIALWNAPIKTTPPIERKEDTLSSAEYEKLNKRINGTNTVLEASTKELLERHKNQTRSIVNLKEGHTALRTDVDFHTTQIDIIINAVNKTIARVKTLVSVAVWLKEFAAKHTQMHNTSGGAVDREAPAIVKEVEKNLEGLKDE